MTSWVDTEQPDSAAASRFYGALFGWTFEDAMPPDAPGTYLIASLDGADAAAIGSTTGGGAARWNTYIAVDDADASAAAVVSAGGRVVVAPVDAGPGGRTATCIDPTGAEFRLWQARRRLGAQVTNTPGAWNFSHLHTAEPASARTFYGRVFGWEFDDGHAGGMIRVPGYGDHLESTIDPDIRERQKFAPPGFADVIGGLEVAPPGSLAYWSVIFTVADRDAAVDLATRSGATVVSISESEWTHAAVLRDPQGADFVVSQLIPPNQPATP